MTKDKKHKMMEITKLYHETNFPEEENCLGYAIDVWQESINQNFNEYLVNYIYLQKLMTNPRWVYYPMYIFFYLYYYVDSYHFIIKCFD